MKAPYVSIPPDAQGHIHYPVENHHTWRTLFERQQQHVQGRAAPEFLRGIAELGFEATGIPQHRQVSARLARSHGWGVEPVAALIPASEFFGLLARKRFPAASFIRRAEDLDYIMEPDIFHEFFGHCPLLTHGPYAEFMHAFGRVALEATPRDRVRLFRLFWFTIEFGLIDTREGLRAYGGGILSSFGETSYALESPAPKRIPFDPIEALRTPFRIDILQPVYFVIKSFDELYHLLDHNLHELLAEARGLGDRAALFSPKTN